MKMAKTSKTHFSHLHNPTIIILFLSISLLLLHNAAVADDTPPIYVPTENIAVDCGSPTNTTRQGDRTWLADSKTTHFFLESGSKTNPSNITEATHQPNLGNAPPYMYARYSYSEFAYVFPVTPGQKFIRLYFNPSNSYPDLDRSKAFFSVNAGRFILLNNFSAFLNLNQGEDTILREFSVNIQPNEPLTLTFTPSSGGCYAFVNGIEILSMPTNLYFVDSLKFLGRANSESIGNDTALEKMYRINVGGKSISSMADATGMFRTWSEDVRYLTIAKPSALPVNTTIHLTFTNETPNYSAPIEVYTTARSMGINKTMNENYNLTWEFPVDSGFTYLVRLHFCEFQSEIVSPGDRQFQIDIANQTAERIADVIEWSSGNGIPVYRDYEVLIGTEGNEKKRNLSVALHTTPEWRTKYSDAILNGVEIFKLSNNGDLSAPNPDREFPKNQPATTQTTSKHRKNHKKPFPVIGGILLGFVAFSLLIFLIFRRKKSVKDSKSSDGASKWTGFSYATTKSSKTRDGSSLPSDLCRHFYLSEIKAATNNFDPVFIVGEGGFGKVYKGFVDGGATTVAIKRLNVGSRQGALEFKTEIDMLSQLRHLHLVSLIGYCNEDREMILVYDYMTRGTLRDHLYKTENPPLPWTQRLQICIGAAHGLHYLHSGTKHMIIHRDVKTTNILLDEKWVAKVSDFGMSKFGPTSSSETHISTLVKGSFGYLDPEYYRRQQLTEKSDVYSFGVVLLEVLSARPPMNRTADKKQASLAVWAQKCYENNTFDQIVDPILKDKIAPESLKKFGEIAISCLFEDGRQRPSMNEVLWGLEFALRQQTNAEKDMKLSTGNTYNEEVPLRDYSSINDDSTDLFSSIGEHVLMSRTDITTTSDEQSYDSKTSTTLMSGYVFSEIKNPKGR